MAVYNGARYVRQAVDSVLAQTFADFEFVIIDDGSTDDSPYILASYLDPRIVLVHNEENLGLAESLNRGLAVARGEYVARQDADDLSHPERVAKQVAFLDAHLEVGVVGTAIERIDDDGHPFQVSVPPTENADIQETLLRFCCLIHGSTMYRRRIALDMGGYDEQMRTGQDYDFWLRISEAWNMACLPEVLYQYRWHEGMISSERRSEQVRNADAARRRAVQRRMSAGWRRLGVPKGRIPEWVQCADRRWLAERYVWWSAGSRSLHWGLALRFLSIALLLDLASPEVWAYVQGILARRLALARKRLGRDGRS